MSFLAPYDSFMRLGSGFNSYTQEMCIQDAVTIFPGDSTTEPPVSSQYYAYHKSADNSNEPPPADTTPSAAQKTDQPGAWWTGPSAPSRISSRMPGSEGGGPLPPGGAQPPVAIGFSPAAQRDGATSPPGTLPSSKTGPGGTANDTAIPRAKTAPPNRNLNQTVTYSSRSVDNLSDIVESLNISASSSIKYGTIKASGSASFVNENKINASDLNYILSVKVTNETSPIPDSMRFNHIGDFDPKDFTEVYGDCFISGFIEGGEFNAIISIKVNSKSKVSAVKAAAEAEFAIAAAPDLTVGTKAEMAKDKSDAWNDTETTISVNWSGGGMIKEPAQKWDLPTVIDVAARFPHLVETCAQRTSAILTRYTSLRSWHDANAALPPDHQYIIKNYELCSLYTQDLFAGYTAFKSLWTRISDTIKFPEKYRAREPSKVVPCPFIMTPESLNNARLLARKGMVQITDEISRLTREPHLAGIDETGNLRPLPYDFPDELARRLPIKLQFPSVRDQVTLSGASKPLTAEEIGIVGKWAALDDISFSPLAGDPPPSKSSMFHRGKNALFCSLNNVSDKEGEIEALTRLRLHAHEHHHMDIFLDFKNHSKSSQSYLSAIGYSSASDMGTSSAGRDGTHKHVGRPSANPRLWSRPADLAMSHVHKAVVEWHPGTGRIAALYLLDQSGNEITSWVQYGQAKAEKPPGMRIEEQVAPDVVGAYRLCGFWGGVDAIVITRIGAIWRKV